MYICIGIHSHANGEQNDPDKRLWAHQHLVHLKEWEDKRIIEEMKYDIHKGDVKIQEI